MFHVPAPMENGQHLQRLRFRAVDDQIGIDRKEPDGHIGQVLAPMSGSGHPRQKNDLLPNGPLNPIGDFNGGFILQEASDFNKIECGFRRKNIAPHLFGLRFLFL
jgi:hypothetical protein